MNELHVIDVIMSQTKKNQWFRSYINNDIKQNLMSSKVITEPIEKSLKFDKLVNFGSPLFFTQ